MGCVTSKNATSPDLPAPPPEDPNPTELIRIFSHKDVLLATGHFSKEKVLGEGGFGKVYKGVVTVPGYPHGQDVAVKVLSTSSFQGERECVNEITKLSVLHHEHLVRLIGFCPDRQCMALVYPLYHRGSLDHLLFSDSGTMLTWQERMGIAYGVMKGLLYLHQNNVIHRDLKCANILLEDDGSPVLADFGMATDGPEGTESHVSIQIMGSLGYLDPAYYNTGRLYLKSDIYSFGVILLELLTGTRSKEEGHTGWVQNWTQERRKEELQVRMDPRLQGRYPIKDAARAAMLARQCILGTVEVRPDAKTVLGHLRRIVDGRQD